MPTDTATDSSALTRDDILGKLREELGDGVPSRCEDHPDAKVQDIYLESGVPRFVTFTCNHRLMVQRTQESSGEHRWRR